MAETQTQRQSTHQPIDRAGRRRRRKWPYIVGGIVLLVIGVIAALPYVLSSQPGTRFLVSQVNQRIPGTVGLGDLTVSWLGPSHFADVTVVDPAGREVLKVARVELAGGIWKALFAPQAFERVAIFSPQATLYRTQQGRFSLFSALRKEPPAKERLSLSDVHPKGRLSVTDGGIQVATHDERMTKISDVAIDITFATLAKVEGTLAATFDDQAQVTGKIDLRDLVTDGALSLQQATGTLQLTTDQPIDLHGLAAFSPTPQALALAGRLSFAVRLDGKPETTTLTYTADVNQFAYGRGATPIDIDLSGDLKVAQGQATGKTTLAGDLGQLAVSYQGHVPDHVPTLSRAELNAALFDGAPLSVPSLTVRANGDLNLALLTRAMPGLQQSGQTATLTAGQLVFDQLALVGGAHPSLTGHLALKKLVTEGPGTTGRIAWQPMTADLDLAIAKDEGLRISQATLHAPFAEVTGSGTLRNLDVQYRLSLAQTMDLIHRVVGQRQAQWAGRLSGQLKMRQTDPQQIRVALDATLDDFAKRQGGETISIKKATINSQGPLQRSDEGQMTLAQKTEVTATTMHVPIAGRALRFASLNATHNGTLRFQDGKLRRVDSETIAIKLDQAIAIAGSGWYNATDTTFALDLPSTRIALGPLQRLMRQVEGSATRYAGRLSGGLTLGRPNKGAPVHIAGKMTAHDLTVNGTTVDKGPATLNLDLRLDQTQQTLSLRQAKLASALLDLDLNGDVSKLDSQKVVDLKGRYTLRWDPAMAMLKAANPKLAAHVAINGESSSALHLSGPLDDPQAKSALAKLTGWLTVGWTSAELYGLRIGRGEISPQLKQGRMDLPQTAIAVQDGGHIRLAGAVDLRQASPSVRIPTKTALLDNVRLTPALNKELVGRINPVLGTLTTVAGTIRLTVQNLILPLGGAGQDSATGGSGVLDLNNLKIRPEGALAHLARWRGLSPKTQLAVDVPSVLFTLKDGKVHYQSFVLLLTKDYPLQFAGAVGPDDGVDMTVSVPVTSGLLTDLGVRGPVAEFARVLNEARVAIPIRGTRSAPQLALGDVNYSGLIKQAQAALAKDVGKRVKDLLRGGQDQNQTAGEKKKPAERVRDALKGLIPG